MAVARLPDVGYELEIDEEGQIYLALGPAERLPIMLLELVIGTTGEPEGLMRMEVEAKFVSTGAPEPRISIRPYDRTIRIVPNTRPNTRRLRLRKGVT